MSGGENREQSWQGQQRSPLALFHSLHNRFLTFLPLFPMPAPGPGKPYSKIFPPPPSHSHLRAMTGTLGLGRLRALDTGRYRLADTSSPKAGEGQVQPGSPAWQAVLDSTKQATQQAAPVGYMCMKQPVSLARRDILPGNSFYKTSDFADGPTLATTRARTRLCVPPALHTAPSEHLLLSPYQVIC